jgi:hypothetical protein
LFGETALSLLLHSKPTNLCRQSLNQTLNRLAPIWLRVCLIGEATLLLILLSSLCRRNLNQTSSTAMLLTSPRNCSQISNSVQEPACLNTSLGWFLPVTQNKHPVLASLLSEENCLTVSAEGLNNLDVQDAGLKISRYFSLLDSN